MSAIDDLNKLVNDLETMNNLWNQVDPRMDPQAESTVSLMKNLRAASDAVASDIEDLSRNPELGNDEAIHYIMRFPNFRNCVFSSYRTTNDIDQASTLAQDLQRLLKEGGKPKGKRIA